jgi:hypothetical protein
VFGRYWLDLILSPVAVPGPPAFIRPWMMDTRASEGIGYSPQEILHVHSGGRLRVSLPAPSRELMVGVIPDGNAVDVEARWSTGETTVTALPIAAQATYVTLSLDSSQREIELRFDAATRVNFVGYRG